MNLNELEDFVQDCISEHTEFRNRILYIYRNCADKIINSIIDNDTNFSKVDEIDFCKKSIKELLTDNFLNDAQ